MRQKFSLGWIGAAVFSFWLISGTLVVFSGITLVDATPAAAQEEGDFDEPEAANEVAADTPAAVSSDIEDLSKSRLKWMFRALGWFYTIVFLSLSFTLVALLIMNLLQARRENIVPLALVEGFETHLSEKRYQEAYEMAKNDDSFLGQVLSAGLAKLSAGYDQAIEAMQEVGEEENMKIEHRLSYMALIGTVSPMIGLLGTVQGMISSFSVIAFSPTAPKPSELAMGISTALFTTLVGLFIAIPAIAIYNILRNRAARLALEVGILSEGLMSRFSSVGAAKKQTQG